MAKTKTEKVAVENLTVETEQTESGKISDIERPVISPDQMAAQRAVVSLIVKLCEDVKSRQVRDEYKTLDAIAALMTSLK